MATPRYLRTSLGLMKRVKLSPNSHDLARAFSSTTQSWDKGEPRYESSLLPAPSAPGPLAEQIAYDDPSNPLSPTSTLRLPRSVQAVYLQPLKRRATYGIPCCDLQLRSYSVRNLEFFADFCLRAAYYLNLPASGPIPLPRITQRWTVPRSNFIFKKSQENFERITLRRLIQIQDGHPEAVEVWLAFIRKHQYHGVGMKANVWGFDKIGVGKEMDVSLQNVKKVLDPKWAHFGRGKNLETSEKVFEMLGSAKFAETARASETQPSS